MSNVDCEWYQNGKCTAMGQTVLGRGKIVPLVPYFKSLDGQGNCLQTDQAKRRNCGKAFNKAAGIPPKA